MQYDCPSGLQCSAVTQIGEYNIHVCPQWDPVLRGVVQQLQYHHGGSGNLVQGSAAQVTATYPYTLSVYGVTASSGTMTAQTTEIIQ